MSLQRPIGRGRGRGRGKREPPGNDNNGLNGGQHVAANRGPIRSTGHQLHPHNSCSEVNGATDRMKKIALSEIGGESGNTFQPGRPDRRGKRDILADIVHTNPKSVESKQGKLGAPIELLANYFGLKIKSEWTLYQYHVSFSPEIDSTRDRKIILRKHASSLGSYIFDGTLLYSHHSLVPPQHEEIALNALWDESAVVIKVKLVADVTSDDVSVLQVLNLVLRKCLDHLKMQLVGREYFDAKAAIKITQHKLELWPGYTTSIRRHEYGFLLCVDIIHKVIRTSTVLDKLEDCTRHNSSDYKKAFLKEIIGKTVMTNYNNRTYQVDDVDFEKNPGCSFQWGNKTITYRDYFTEKYHVNITDSHQPLLISRSKRRHTQAGMPDMICLIPELCQTTGYDDSLLRDFAVLRDVSKHTRVGPDNRINHLRLFNQRLLRQKAINAELQNLDMEMSTDLIKLHGRVLNKESVLIGNKPIQFDPIEGFTKLLRSNPLHKVFDISNWVVITPIELEESVIKFVGVMQRAAYGMRLSLTKPYYSRLPDNRIGTYVGELNTVMKERNPQIIMCILKSAKVDTYAAIKKKCCVERAMPTQVVLNRVVQGQNLSIATNIAIQMTCKVGGTPWSVNIPLEDVMYAGFDVYHETHSKHSSFGALVASVDKDMGRYFSSAIRHNPSQEISDELCTEFAKALEAYKIRNNSLPKIIVFYRDGVGEGQLSIVHSREVSLLKNKLNEIYKGIPPKLLFITVNKRIKTRLFADGQNPPPGTVVDDVITLPYHYDFFIVSQSVRQGTVTPTYYIVLEDTLKLAPDYVQRMTYRLTYMYYNYAGPIRVPAPVQFAHKLAYLSGNFLRASPTESWDSRLYYL